MAEPPLVVPHGGEIGEVKSAWYGGDFWVFLGTFSRFMGMLWHVHGFPLWFATTRSVVARFV